jgi:protein ImuB
MAASAAAIAGGAAPGLSLTEARAVLPNLVVAPADPAADARALAALADWCGRYTPWTAVDPLGGETAAGSAGLWLDISGCAHLFGGERALVEDLALRLEACGLAARAAIADSPGAAWAMARFADQWLSIVAPGEAEDALALLPVAALRLPGDVIEALQAVGLRRIEDLLPLPRAPLAARFGQLLPERLDQAMAAADEPISPKRPVPAMASRLAFAEPIGRVEDIALAARHLLDELCARLAAAHQGARRLELRLYRTDATATGVAIGTSRPEREPKHLERLFAEKLTTVDAGFGIDAMVLGALVVEPLAPAQAAMGFAGGSKTDGLARLIDNLGNRLGPDRVALFRQRQSHLPERACAEVPAFAAGARQAAAARAPLPAPADARSRQPRPVHLLAWPEPIDVIAPVPDGPPVLFRWRRRPHRVAAAEGPERIEAEWWEHDGGHDPERAQPWRDYYRIEDETGRRFWVYRLGGYRPGAPARWFLHGRFA